MLQVMMRIEQEQRVTEDARRMAEQDAAAQRHFAAVLQEKYEEAINSLSAMEKRAVMAESMLEATLLCESNQPALKKAPDSRSVREELSKIALLRASSQRETPQEASTRRHSLLSRTFSIGWRDRSKLTGSLDLEALLSPKSYSSGTKRETYFDEHPKSPLAVNGSNGISKDHPSETDELNVSS